MGKGKTLYIAEYANAAKNVGGTTWESLFSFLQGQKQVKTAVMKYKDLMHK